MMMLKPDSIMISRANARVSLNRIMIVRAGRARISLNPIMIWPKSLNPIMISRAGRARMLRMMKMMVSLLRVILERRRTCNSKMRALYAMAPINNGRMLVTRRGVRFPAS